MFTCFRAVVPSTSGGAGPYDRREIHRIQSLFGSKGVVGSIFWIRGQICAFLAISNRLVQFAGSDVEKNLVVVEPPVARWRFVGPGSGGTRLVTGCWIQRAFESRRCRPE